MPYEAGLKERDFSFDPSDYKQKAHLDLMFLLVKQAFALRYPNELLVGNPDVNPEVCLSSRNTRQPMDRREVPTAAALESLIHENVPELNDWGSQ